jgi:endonuclease-8
MPEGPEIRRAADELARALVGRVAETVEFYLPRLAAHGPRLAGQRIVAVTPRAKAMLIRFSGGQTVYSHNQLYGRWKVSRAGRVPGSSRALRLVIANDGHVARLYSATDIELLDEAGLAQHPYLAKLGPDLLDPLTTVATVRATAGTARFQRRALAGLLLDQGFYAGLGNYLRSEILYVAGLRHEQTLGSLTTAERERLADTSLALTRQSYRSRGVTNDLGQAAALKARGVRFADYRHHVFGRDGQPCWRCDEPIVRTDVAGRGIYFCPTCQPGPHHPTGRRGVRRRAY